MSYFSMNFPGYYYNYGSYNQVQDPAAPFETNVSGVGGPAGTGASLSGSPLLNITVRVINPGKKKETRVFTLRSVCADTLKSPQQLRDKLLEQFGSDIVPGDTSFELGYFRGQKKCRFVPKKIYVKHGATSVKVQGCCGVMESTPPQKVKAQVKNPGRKVGRKRKNEEGLIGCRGKGRKG